MGVGAALLGNRKDLHLHRRKPRGELAGEMLDQDADEALDGAEAHAMQHDRSLLLAVGVGVLEVEIQRHLEVELHRAALPRATQRIVQMEVDFGTVEGAIALVDHVVHAELVERGLQAAFGGDPILVGAHGVLGARGQFDVVGEAELVVDGRDQIGHADDFLGQLVGAHEQMRVVLVEATDAEQAVQSALELVAVNQADFARANRQLAIAMRLGRIDQHAAGAVHRLDAVLLFIDRRRVHVVLVVVPVAGGLPEVTVHDLRRGDFHIARGVMDLAPVVEQGVLDGSCR